MRRLLLILGLFATTAGAVGLNRPTPATAGVIAQDQICDVAADYALGREDYPRAIRLHQKLVAARPNDALAHYHLGFAYGMAGRTSDELAEYRQAATLGLRQWDLYVNLGRLYLEHGNYPAAADALRSAVALGPSHAEAHFNLGLAYEREMLLPQAEDEVRTALRLGADRAEAGNMLAVICAENGRIDEARQIWTTLTLSPSTAAAARANLAILARHANAASAATGSAPLPVVYAQARP